MRSDKDKVHEVAGHRHHRLGGPAYSGTKSAVTTSTLAGEGEAYEKEVGVTSGKIV